MIASICLGFLGSIFALMGMKCTNVGGSGRSKAKVAFSAGVMYILAGLSPLVACSWYAHQIILEHYDPIMPKYELGTALFSGWAGATLCILGGLSFCLSVTEDKHSQSYLLTYRNQFSVNIFVYIYQHMGKHKHQ